MDTAQFQLHAAIEERHWWFTARRTILSRLVGYLQDNKQLRAAERAGDKPLLIDIGCGPVRISPRLPIHFAASASILRARRSN